MENIIIELAGNGDLEDILQLQKQCYLQEAELYDDYEIEPLQQTIFSLKKEAKEGTILKGVVNEKIVASVRGTIRENTAYIGKLFVSESFQNKKIGQLMMKSIEEKLSTCEMYELFTGDRSEKNLHLYKKIGYKEVRREYINEELTLIYLNKKIEK